MGGSSETGTNASSSLLGRKKSSWRDHYVNGLPFTVCMSTFAIVTAGSVALGASMLVAGGAKEANVLVPPVDTSLKSSVYGAHHAGVGFANYVVGNAVSKFWSKEMGAKSGASMSDPFSFLRKGNKKNAASVSDDGSSDTTDEGATGDDESPQHRADDAQPVDALHHRIAGAPATDEAMQHVQDVAQSHNQQDVVADQGREHLLKLLHLGHGPHGAVTRSAAQSPKLHAGMFREVDRGRHHVRVPSDADIEAQAGQVRAARGRSATAQKLHQQLVVTSGKGGIPELHITKGGKKAREDDSSSSSGVTPRSALHNTKSDQVEAMETLRNAEKDLMQKTPGHVEPVKRDDDAVATRTLAATSEQRPTESYFAYKYRIAHGG